MVLPFHRGLLGSTLEGMHFHRASAVIRSTHFLPQQSAAEWSRVEEQMSSDRVMCMASGCVDGVHKYFFFAQEDRSAAFFLVEVVGEPTKNRITARFKTETDRSLPHFLRHFKIALSRALSLPSPN